MVFFQKSMPAVLALAQLLTQKNLSCATAESCTGGLVGAAFTHVPGSSAWFQGGIIAYSNEIKQQLLNVSGREIEEHGAVSHAVVRSMARGACTATQAAVAVSLSGVAGPDGGSPEKPVGTVYIGVAVSGATESYLHHFSGNREEVREQATLAAILHLTKTLEHLE